MDDTNPNRPSQTRISDANLNLTDKDYGTLRREGRLGSGFVSSLEDRTLRREDRLGSALV